jgi:uncharacterized membrane protein
MEDGTVLKAHLIPQMKALCNSVAELVNFGISVRNFNLALFLINYSLLSSWHNKLCPTLAMHAAQSRLSN